MDIKQFLLIFEIVICILLITSILLQVRGSGLGTMFGNIGGEFYRSKRGVEQMLYRATIILSFLFVCNSIALAYIYSN